MLSLAPLAAGAAGATAGASALTTAATIAGIAAPIASGIQSSNEAKAQEIQSRANEQIGKTRAMQTGTVAMQGMESELASLRAALSANNQPIGAGAASLFSELRKVRGREARIEVSNANNQAADYRAQARSYGMAGGGALLGGLVKAAPSVFDLMQLGK